MKKKIKLGAGFPGGGFNASFQIGVALKCKEMGIKFDYINASSSGIWNAVMLAAKNGGAKQAAEFWRHIYPHHFFQPALREWLRDGRIDSFFSNKKIEEKLLAVADIYDQREDMEVEISILNLDSNSKGVEYVSSHSPDFREAVWAGTAIAPIYPAVFIKNRGHQYIDGGLGRNFMVQRCFEKGCDAVVLINIIETQKTQAETAKASGKIRDMKGVLWRTARLVIHRVFADSEGQATYDRSKVLKIFSPKGTYWSTLYASNWWFQQMMRAGYEEAERIFATTDFFSKLGYKTK